MRRREASSRERSRERDRAEPTSRVSPSGVLPSGVSPELTVAIRVTPRAARTAVGGRRGAALMVRVTEAAVDGRATEAALVALARALGRRRQDVELRSGMTSRDKIVTVGAATPDVVARLAELMDDAGASPVRRRRS